MTLRTRANLIRISFGHFEFGITFPLGRSFLFYLWFIQWAALSVVHRDSICSAFFLAHARKCWKGGYSHGEGEHIRQKNPPDLVSTWLKQMSHVKWLTNLWKLEKIGWTVLLVLDFPNFKSLVCSVVKWAWLFDLLLSRTEKDPRLLGALGSNLSTSTRYVCFSWETTTTNWFYLFFPPFLQTVLSRSILKHSPCSSITYFWLTFRSIITEREMNKMVWLATLNSRKRRESCFHDVIYHVMYVCTGRDRFWATQS